MSADGILSPSEEVHLLRDRLNTAVNLLSTQTFFCELEIVRLSHLDPLALSDEVLSDMSRHMMRSSLNEFAMNMHTLALKIATAATIANEYLQLRGATSGASASSSAIGQNIDPRLIQKAFETSLEACASSGSVNFLGFYMDLVGSSNPVATSNPELVFPEEKPERVPVMPKKAWRQRYEEEMRFEAVKAEMGGHEKTLGVEDYGHNEATGAVSVEDLDVLMNQEVVNEEETIDLDQSISFRHPDDQEQDKFLDVLPSETPIISNASEEVLEHTVVEDAMDRDLAEDRPVSPMDNISMASACPSSSTLTHEDLELAKHLLSFAGVEIPSEKEASEALEKMTAMKIEPDREMEVEEEIDKVDNVGFQPSIFVKREVITPDSSELLVHVISSGEVLTERAESPTAGSVIGVESCSSVAITSPPTQSPEHHPVSPPRAVEDIPLPPAANDPYIVREPDSDDQQMPRKKQPTDTIHVVEVYSDDEGNTHERVVARCRSPPALPPPDEYPSQQRMRAASRMPYGYPGHQQMQCVPLPVTPLPLASFHTWNAHSFPASPANYVPHGMCPSTSAAYNAVHSTGFQPRPPEYDPCTPGTSYDGQQQRNEYKRRPEVSGGSEERMERKKTRFHD